MELFYSKNGTSPNSITAFAAAFDLKGIFQIYCHFIFTFPIRENNGHTGKP